jgi:hypothetical protein
MHWVKLLVEGWVLLGIVTVMVGVIWTKKQGNELSKPRNNLISPPKLRPELSPANVSKHGESPRDLLAFRAR